MSNTYYNVQLKNPEDDEQFWYPITLKGNITDLTTFDSTHYNTSGLVPSSSGETNKFLCADGSWSTPTSNPTVAGLITNGISAHFFRTMSASPYNFVAGKYIPLIKIVSNSDRMKMSCIFEIITREDGGTGYAKYYINHRGPNGNPVANDFLCLSFRPAIIRPDSTSTSEAITRTERFSYDDIVYTIKYNNNPTNAEINIYKKVAQGDNMFVVNILAENNDASDYSVQHYYYVLSSSVSEPGYSLMGDDSRIATYYNGQLTAKLYSSDSSTTTLTAYTPENATYYNYHQIADAINVTLSSDFGNSIPLNLNKATDKQIIIPCNVQDSLAEDDDDNTILTLSLSSTSWFIKKLTKLKIKYRFLFYLDNIPKYFIIAVDGIGLECFASNIQATKYESSVKFQFPSNSNVIAFDIYTINRNDNIKLILENVSTNIPTTSNAQNIPI